MPQATTSASTFQEQFSPTVRCYTCQQLGHIKRVCPYGRQQQQQRGHASPGASTQYDVYRNNMLSAHHGSRPRESRKGHRSSKLLLNSPLLVDQDVATTSFSPGDTARGGKYGTTDVKVEESSACTCGQEEESERVYLDVKIKGRNRQCLLDSDCDFTVIPAKYVSPTSIMRSSRTLLAANGTPIPIIGSALLRGTVGRQTVEISGLVTDHVHDIMLRVDWLRAYEVNWNFANSTVNIGGATHKLVSRGRKNNITCRRVIVTEDTVVPPWSQSNVSTDTV